MSGLRERVAKAIVLTSGEISLAFTEDQPADTETIRKCRRIDTAKALEMADAAILEMREPTKDMYEAAKDADYKMDYGNKPKTSHTWFGISAGRVAAIYHAMLDAALKDEPASEGR